MNNEFIYRHAATTIDDKVQEHVLMMCAEHAAGVMLGVEHELGQGVLGIMKTPIQNLNKTLKYASREAEVGHQQVGQKRERAQPDVPEPGNSRMKCFKCRQPGHKAAECKN